MTVCVPCHDKGKPNVPAMRFIPLHGANIPMCEACFGGGLGPGMAWRPPGTPVQQDVKPKPKPAPPATAPDVKELIAKHNGRLESLADKGQEVPAPKPMPISPGRTSGRSNGGQDVKAETKERNRRMQEDRDNGMSVPRIAQKFDVSEASVYMNTHASAPKKIAARPPARKEKPPKSGNGMDFDALIAKLESQKEELELAIEAVKRVRKLVEGENA
jgi:hypothetical protein